MPRLIQEGTSYSNHTDDAVPAYKLPLQDQDLILLGRLMAYWAQIDMFVDELIEEIFSLTHNARRVLVGDKVVGTKLAIVKKGANGLEDEVKRLSVLSFIELAESVQEKRNHAAHGVWAWHIEPGASKAYLSARKAKDLKAELRPNALPALVAQAAKASRAGLSAMTKFNGFQDAPPIRLFYGSEAVGDDWLPPI